MTRQDLVLALLACADGRTYTPVQIQKAVFLVTRNLPQLIDGHGFHFTPYDYGPFDSDVYAEAQTLSAEGNAAIAPSGFGRWSTYAATDAGVTQGRALLGRLDNPTRDYIVQISNWVRSQSFGSLVKSIYEAYPEMRANSIFRG